MPNWCYNFATVSCPSREIYDKLLKSINDDKWFETFAPLNSDIHHEETTNDDETIYDYSKAVEIWKTKWPAHEVDIINQYDDDMAMELSFETAWSPPTGVYTIMSKEFGIDITGFYNEPGCEFFGRCIYSKEEEVELDETFHYPNNKEELVELKKLLGHELDDFMSPSWEILEEQWESEESEENQ
jgi:hypothetical protein